MAAVQQHQIHIKPTGHTVTIPNAPMAKIMYYLNSVDVLTDFGIPNNLKNYNNYSRLSNDEENQVLALAVLLPPTLFINNGIMIQNDSLCPNCTNEFYEISDTRTAVAVTHEFVIAGQRVHTLKVMAFKVEWMQSNYVDPIRHYSKRIESLSNQNSNPHGHQNRNYQGQHQSHQNNNYRGGHQNNNYRGRGQRNNHYRGGHQGQRNNHYHGGGQGQRNNNYHGSGQGQRNNNYHGGGQGQRNNNYHGGGQGQRNNNYRGGGHGQRNNNYRGRGGGQGRRNNNYHGRGSSQGQQIYHNRSPPQNAPRDTNRGTYHNDYSDYSYSYSDINNSNQTKNTCCLIM